MKRISISISDDTLQGVDLLANTLGCSRSALVDVLLARGLVKRLLDHRAHLISIGALSADSSGPAKRNRGESVQDIEQAIHDLERDYQGDLWHALD